jgi:hypothetical protein
MILEHGLLAEKKQEISCFISSLTNPDCMERHDMCQVADIVGTNV